MIYFDSAATSFYRPPCVREAVAEAIERMGNAGRGAHGPALEAARAIYRARTLTASLFGVADPGHVVFTSNATEALNIAIGGLLAPGETAVTTAMEHNSVLRPLYRLQKQGVRLNVLPADRKGRVAPEAFERAVVPGTRLVVVGHASNLCGNVQQIRALGALCRERGALFVVDAAQTAGALPIDMAKDHIDALCFSGHKGLLGPQGVGGLCLREGVLPRPLKVGGSGVQSFSHGHPACLPEALEAGTANAHALAGFAAALAYLQEQGVQALHARETALCERLLAGVRALEGVEVYGDVDASPRAAIVALNVKGMSSAAVADKLWEKWNICVRAGAHCAPLAHEALGTAARGVVRFSLSPFNTPQQVDTAVVALGELAGGQGDAA